MIFTNSVKNLNGCTKGVCILAAISNVDETYIVCGKTDIRKSIGGLCGIIQNQFSIELTMQSIFFVTANVTESRQS